jgi:hypothetical protein
MSVQHVDITDPNIHEMKGAAAASANTVPIADGAGGTAFALLGSSNISAASVFNVNKFAFGYSITDINTAGTLLVAFPFACTLTRVTTILHGTIATADEVLTFTNSTGPVAMGTMTITASGSAEGDIDTFTPASNNTFAAGTYCKITNPGDCTNTVRLNLLFEITRTA